jgi:hypothetical protein
VLQPLVSSPVIELTSTQKLAIKVIETKQVIVELCWRFSTFFLSSVLFTLNQMLLIT